MYFVTLMSTVYVQCYNVYIVTLMSTMYVRTVFSKVCVTLRKQENCGKLVKKKFLRTPVYLTAGLNKENTLLFLFLAVASSVAALQINPYIDKQLLTRLGEHLKQPSDGRGSLRPLMTSLIM